MIHTFIHQKLANKQKKDIQICTDKNSICI